MWKTFGFVVQVCLLSGHVGFDDTEHLEFTGGATINRCKSNQISMILRLLIFIPLHIIILMCKNVQKCICFENKNPLNEQESNRIDLHFPAGSELCSIIWLKL